MAAHKVNLDVDQGATFDKLWAWKLDGQPVNLTGCTAWAQSRPDVHSSTVLLSMTTENGRIILGGSAGTVKILIADEDTASLRTGTYDLFVGFPAGNSVCLMAGNITVTPRVTRT